LEIQKEGLNKTAEEHRYTEYEKVGRIRTGHHKNGNSQIEFF